MFFSICQSLTPFKYLIKYLFEYLVKLRKSDFAQISDQVWTRYLVKYLVKHLIKYLIKSRKSDSAQISDQVWTGCPRLLYKEGYQQRFCLLNASMGLSNESITSKHYQSNCHLSDLRAFGAQAVQAWIAGLTVCK